MKISSFATMTNESEKSPDTSDSGIKIGEVTSENSEENHKKSSETEEGNKVVNSEDSPIKIASVVSEDAEASKDSESEKPESAIKIANIASEKGGNDDDIVNLDDDDDNNENNDKDKPQAKPVLKLASFASSSTNGISEEEPSAPSPPPCVAKCELSGKEISSFKSAVAWETMLFFDDTCLGKNFGLRLLKRL